MNKKARHITLIAISALCLIALFCTLFFVFSKDDNGDAEHKIKNKLDQSIDIVPFYSNGNLLAYKNGEIITLAQNVYDLSATDALYTADYALNAEGSILFVSDKKLYLNKDGNTTLLISDVISWRISNDFSRVAFITNSNTAAIKGNLYLFSEGETKILDTSVLVGSLFFSEDGQTLYAQKENVYPKSRYMLIEYSDFSESKVVLEECNGIKLVLENSVICARTSGELSEYTIYSRNFKKSVSIKDTFYPSISENGKYAFFLKNYSTSDEKGVLIRVDLRSLRQQELAKEVSLFSCDVVTNSNQGIVYSRKDFEDAYSIYYKSFSDDEEVRLIHKTDEASIYNVAVNTQKNTAFILTVAPRRVDNAVYYLDFNSKPTTQKIASGYIDSLTYYEELDKVTFVTEPETASKVFIADKTGNKDLLCEGVATSYDNTLRKFSAKTILLDNKKCLYFISSKEDPDVCTMLLSQNESTVLAQNVLTSQFFMPIVQADGNQIFYCVQNGVQVDLYHYANGKIECIAQNVDGIVDM